MITVGGREDGASRWPLPPRSSTSSSWTTFTTCWAGVSDLSTSWPTALSLTRSTKARTTLKFTSASSRATRTSRSASWILSSDSRPRLPRRSKTLCSRVLKESNMETQTLREDVVDFKSRRGVVSDALSARDEAAHEARLAQRLGQAAGAEHPAAVGLEELPDACECRQRPAGASHPDSRGAGSAGVARRAAVFHSRKASQRLAATTRRSVAPIAVMSAASEPPAMGRGGRDQPSLRWWARHTRSREHSRM